MYLIHLKLRLEADRLLPSGTADLVRAAARPGDRLEHVTVHPDAPGGPVLGLFLLADRLEQAEEAADALCRRALAASPELRGAALLDRQVGLVPQYYDRIAAPGRLMTAGNPSTGNLFHPF
ncbi:hypothetical protein [Streptomyces bambusae]|uniref:hypothetical protein n=1 Tax=Streptomyces bambusae TaxID=1550616 RepID=UPI001CA599CC|nr:hypothetical protein [Streptomyces bambusae]